MIRSRGGYFNGLGLFIRKLISSTISYPAKWSAMMFASRGRYIHVPKSKNLDCYRLICCTIGCKSILWKRPANVRCFIIGRMSPCIYICLTENFLCTSSSHRRSVPRFADIASAKMLSGHLDKQRLSIEGELSHESAIPVVLSPLLLLLCQHGKVRRIE